MNLTYSPWVLIFLTFTSFFTSGLSAATGMGGGVLLYSVMSLFFPMQVLIPIHGLIQFVNNVFIVGFLKNYLNRKFIQPFLIGALIGVFLAALIVEKIIQTKIPQILIVLLILYTLFKPKKLPDLKVSQNGFVFVGLITGFFSIIAGAVDPVLAPFFVRDDMNKEEIIANKAMMQAIVHLLKIPVYLWMGFDYLPYLSLCLILNAACIFGTKFGIIILKKLNEKMFNLIFKYALMLTGARILFKIFI
jgi:uncharacterized membrane protein YfcA